MPQAIVAFVFPTLVAGTTGYAVATGVVSIGLSLGIGYVANALNRPSIPKPEDVQGVLRQSVNPRMRHYGRVKAGGPLAFAETLDGSFYQIVMHGDGPFDGYEEIFIDNRLVELDEDGGVITSPYSASNQMILDRLGTTGQTAFTPLVTAFPSIWTSDHRLIGVGCTYMRADSVDPEDVNKVYPNRLPAVNRIIRGAKCYDPRDGDTNWTRNGSLILGDYLTHRDGMNMPSNWIDWDSFGVSATTCAQNLTTKDGSTIARYPIALTYSFDAEPKDVLGRVLTATDGRLYLTGEGKIAFDAGKWVAPSITITDDHLIGYELTDGSGPLRQANQIIVQYTQVPVGYKQATSDPWRDEESIDLIGELTQTVTAYEIQHHNHARRIAKLAAERANPRWVGTISTNLYGLNVWDQRWFTLQISDLEINETFEVTGPPSLDLATMTMMIPVQSFSSAAYDFDPATEEGTEPTVPDDVADPDIDPPEGVVTNKELRKISDDGENDIKVYVGTITWDAPERKGLYAEARYSLNGGFDWLGMTVASKGRKAETPPLPRGSDVDFQVRFRANGGGHSDWTNGDTVSIPA